MIKKIYFKVIKFYQILISPFWGGRCRFYPSCSEYSFQSVKKYGILKGTIKSLKRILKCSPLNKGGVDLP